jgi:CheY-like chemotaxis protein
MAEKPNEEDSGHRRLTGNPYSFSEYLRAEGYEVDTSADGASGIEMVEKKSYD